MRSEAPRLRAEETLLLIVDVQERLHPAMHAELRASLDQNLARWAQAAQVLGLPVMVTEQYPKGLGPTVPALRAALMPVLGPDFVAHEKLSFDALGDDGIRAALESTGRRSILVAGMEAHICVFQTARAIEASGRRAFVLTDAVASRTRENWSVGLDLMRQAGACLTSTEAALFDLVGIAGTDAFRAVSKLVR